MSRDSSGSYLSAVFVDYDNIYLSLKRKSEQAAKLFAKDSYRWVRAIESGRLINRTNGPKQSVERRLVMSRCYGDPVPRRNQSDSTTDMNSFPFVRHHFLRGGFEIVDCPPLTAQLKNSADIRMVMDIRDFITHDTYFDEFVILSSDADFTPLLHRLRAHARRTIVYSNDRTAAPYAALCDGEVREEDLVEFLLEEMAIEADEPAVAIEPPTDPVAIRNEIIAEVVRAVLSASAPQPLEVLAERAIRTLGHAKTVATEWGGAGNFRELLAQDLPASVAITEQAPYFAYDVSRAIARHDPQRSIAPPAAAAAPVMTPQPAASAPRAPLVAATPAPAPELEEQISPARAVSLQESIAEIHQACKAPPLSPPEYRALFTLLANELAANQMQGHQTIDNVLALSREIGIDIKRDDIRFIIDIVGKEDPWFEKNVSAIVFASRFRNFVIGRCQEAGMQLSADEIDLIDAWFAGGHSPEQLSAAAEPAARHAQPLENTPPVAAAVAETSGLGLGDRTARWWQETTTPRESDLAAAAGGTDGADEFPRIVRNRLKA